MVALAVAPTPSLARERACALDPAVYAERARGYELDPWQRYTLRSVSDRLIGLTSRQAGKSSTVGELAAWTSTYQPESLTLILSPTQRQSGETLLKAVDCYHASQSPVLAESESALTLKLANGSRIIGLPGKQGTVRGYSGVDLLIIEEAAFVREDLYAAVRPMLAVSHGRLALISTAFGKQGFFYEAWTNGGPAWDRIMVPATDCPRITPEFLAEERLVLGDWSFRAEYMCEFLDPATAVFTREEIDRMSAPDAEEWSVLG